MNLIISEHDDVSTDYVIDWITYYKKDFLRINRDDFLTEQRPDLQFEISSSTSNMTLSDVEVPIKDITSVWFRREMFSALSPDIFDTISSKRNFFNLQQNFYSEYYNSNEIFLSFLANTKKKIGNYRKTRIHKMHILAKAKEMGLEIPSSIITSRKESVEIFFKQHRATGIITKPLGEVINLEVEKGNQLETYINYTSEITADKLETMPPNFFYSLFQEKIIKDIEIRVFYLHKKCYSMAIFSQLDTQTSLDFRKYSNNRNVPYNLSKDIEGKLIDLMNAVGLDTGSIDLIKTKDGRYVFLELNPNGQYGMTSDPCNYHLDKIIAEHLINN